MDKPFFTIRELADAYANGNYHEVYHLLRKGALEAERPKPYCVRVTTTSVALVFDQRPDPPKL